MLLCVTMGKLDKLRQSTGAIDSISREIALRRETELQAALEDVRALQRERDEAQASLDDERATFVRDVMELREEVAGLSERVAKLRGAAGKGPYGGARTGGSLVDDPADDCALLLDGAFRRQMDALRRAFQREIARLKETKHRSECDSGTSNARNHVICFFPSYDLLSMVSSSSFFCFFPPQPAPCALRRRP